MIPILFLPTATSFTGFGVGVLADAISPHVREELNGEYTLELSYPMDGVWFESIQMRSIILARPNPQDEPQPFRVKRISRPINGIVQIYAEHLSYDLSGVPVLPFEALNAGSAMYNLMHTTAVANPFTMVSELDQAGDLSVTKPATARGLLGGGDQTVLGVYGGELAYDTYRVVLKQRRGADRDIVIRYGVDLVDLNQEESCAEVYTGVLPFWTMRDSVVIGTVQSAGNFNYSRVLPLDVSPNFDERPSVAEVNAAGRSYISEHSIGVPKVSLAVKFAQHPELEALRGAVALGDALRVEFVKLGVDVPARVITTDFDVVSERYISVDVGDPLPNIADTLAGIDREIPEVVDTPAFKAAVLQLTADILGATGGAVRLLDTNGDDYPDTLYIADDPDPDQATHVWRFNYMGWGYSSTGFNGTYTMGASINGGIVANFVTAGTMLADRISGGTLTLGGLNNASGVFSLLNIYGNQIVGMDNTGIAVQNTNTKDTHYTNGLVQITAYGLIAAATYTYYSTRALQTKIASGEISFLIDNAGLYIEVVEGSSAAPYVGFELTRPALFASSGFAFGGSTGANSNANNAGYMVQFQGAVRAWSLAVTGTKSRAAETEGFGSRLLYSYETPTPMFGDVGEAEIDEDGRCFVALDPVFAETVTVDDYQVFLQKYGRGDLWVAERAPGWFVAEGDPGLRFGWEIKARQKGYDQLRLDSEGFLQEEKTADYGANAADYIKNLMEGRGSL